MNRIRHATTGEARKHLVIEGKELVTITELKTACNIWVNAEHCTEDLKAECRHCVKRVNSKKIWNLEQ